ncbi:MAG: hypothetical protein U0Y10_23845 [Spirosomataceae bacterium]
MAIFENDDEGFDFDDINPDDYDSEEIRREIEEEDKRVRNLPIMKKAEEIFDLTHAICESMSDDDPMSEMTKGLMMENAMILAPKIAGAEGGDLYPLRMENAVLIRINAKQLLTQCTSCEIFELANFEYIELLRNALEDFRLLFIEWTNSFDKTNVIVDDEWGDLFR